MKKNLLITILAVMLVFQTGLPGAKKIPPDQIRITTPAYSPELPDFNPRQGRYIYIVSWQGIPAGTINLEFKRNTDQYEISANVRSAKAIDYVYKLRFRTKGILSAETLMPKQSVFITNENDRKKKIELAFFPNGEIQSVYTDNRGGRESVKFNPGNFTLDPFSTAFLALSMNWEVGDKRQFDTYNGRNRYLIELTAVEKTDITVNGKTQNVIVISPGIQKLTDTDTKKLRNARIYITADSSREILKISSDLFFGTVDVDMVDFIPAKQKSAGEKTDQASPTGDNAPVATMQ
jgi:hypothetical protein